MKKQKFGFTGTSDLLQKFSIGAGQWLYVFISTVGTLFVSIGASLVCDYDFGTKWDEANGLITCTFTLLSNPFFLLFIGVVFLGIGGKGVYNDQRNLLVENDKLKKDISKVDQYKRAINGLSEDCDSLQSERKDLHTKLVRTWLKSCYKQLALSNTERVSIHYYIDDHFYILARHSMNPLFAKVIIQKYQIDKGVVALAWQYQRCIDIQACPSYKENPSGYIDHTHNSYSIDKVLIESRTMKSCQYIAISIVESDNNIGVIVFESETNSRFTNDTVCEIEKFCYENQSFMVDFIRNGIEYDKSAKASVNHAKTNVDRDFLADFKKEG